MASKQPSEGTWGDWWAYIALRFVVCLVQSMSLEMCDRWCWTLATIVTDWTPLRRKTTDANLELVYGNLSKKQTALLRRKMWHHLFLMVCEITHAPRKIHRSNWRDHVYMPDKIPVFKAMMDHRATVLVTGHFGNFEVAGFLIGMLGSPPTTIARPLDNPYIDQFVTDFRSRDGQQILPKEGSSTAVQELLDDGGTLAILADQHAGDKGVWAEFFGHPTSCHKALALFVLSAKAPMIVNHLRRLDRPLQFEMGITGIADPEVSGSSKLPDYLESVGNLTEWYNECLERMIRLSPEQYWWLHRRWRDIPAGQLKRLQARKAKRLAKPQVSTSS